MSKSQRWSRCSNRAAAPYTWFDFVDNDHPSVVHLDEWLSSLSMFAENVERGRIDNLFCSAANGELWESDDNATQIKPITTDPELFELRHKAMKFSLRFYHAEPEHRPDLLVALHRHIKKDNPSQQTEIDFAVDRYRRKAT